MTHATRPAGRQLAAFAPATADEDGAQLDLIEEVAALDLPGIACPECGRVTIAPTPGRPEEVGDYCEPCGRAWDRAAVLADRPELAGPLSGLTVAEMAAELADAAEEMAADDAAALELRRLDKGPCPDGHCTQEADHAGPCPQLPEVDAARALVAGRLAEIRAELADLVDALDPATPEGHAAARAFHALAPFAPLA